MYLSPNDPAQLMLSANGQAYTKEQLNIVRENLGLNEPFLKQYFSWALGCIHGDFGTSYITGKPVSETLLNALWPTIQLSITSLIFTLVISIPLGILSAVKKNKVADYIIRIFSFIGSAVPGFLLALILIYVFSIKLGVLPAYGNNKQYSIVMPTITLGLGMTCKYIRQVRHTVLEELNKDYVIGAKARGLSYGKILLKHVFPNSLLPLITLLGLSLGSLLGGTAVVEVIFSYPGLGNLAVTSITAYDYPVIQAYVLWIALIYMIINLIVDLSYTLVDPKVRERG